MPEQVLFIGRKDEKAKITELVKKWGERQVICIHGDGGIGKTRLLQEIHGKYLQPEHQIISEKIEKKAIKIALVSEFTAPEWSELFVTGAKDMATELGIELIETDAGFDLDQMIIDLENVILKSPDAIIIYHGSNEKLQSIMQRAIDQGIKVLTFDNDLHIDGLMTRVAQDDYQGAHLTLDKLAEKIDFQGKIAIVWRKDLAPEKRRKSILDNLLLKYPDIQLVAEFGATVGNIGEDTYQEIKNILHSHPDIQAIWEIWDEPKKDVIRTLIEEGRTDIPVYSFDLCPSDIELMLQPNSPWKVTVATDAKEAGRIMVRLATQAAYGYEIQHQYLLPMKLITQELLREAIRSKQSLLGESEVGWMPCLRSLQSKGLQTEKRLIQVTGIIDFDDPSFRNPENMSRKIANMIDPEVFKPFFRAQVDYHKMQAARVSSEGLRKQSLMTNQAFAECFNKVSHKKRVILFFDTTDHLKEGEEVWQDLEVKIPQLRNVVILLAGRNAKRIGRALQKNMTSEVEIINLKPLSEEDSRVYLEQQQQQKYISIEPDLAEKLIFLSGGRPILLDLAVEWRARGISLEWLVKESLKKIQSLDKEKKEKRQQEFEKHLVTHIKDLRSPMDQLILVMSYVYPLNIRIISEFLKEENAKDLFEQAKSYVFVKLLPNGYLSLHDEMRRMIKDYVWPEIDPEYGRRRWYSELAKKYIADEIENLMGTLKEKSIEKSVKIGREEYTEETLELSLELDELKQRLWTLKEQQIDHALLTNIDEAIKIFVKSFNDATKTSRFSFRQHLFDKLQKYAQRFSPEQTLIRDLHQVQLFFDKGEYKQAKALCEKILRRTAIQPELKIETLIALANVKIRLGNVEKSIPDFAKAVKLSEAHKLPLWSIKARNGLGYAHRLIGDLDHAQQSYQKAQHLCWQEGGPDNVDLRDDYGWISNNLAFVLSNDNKTRRIAINIARSTLEYWRLIGNEIGLGAGYLVLGIAYYRADLHWSAILESFQEALNIFQPLKHNDWLGQIYSWRGASYQDMGKLDEAKRDLEESLKIGPKNIEAMTLNRLGRVYMSQCKWDEAEEYIQRSLRRAKQIPDYKYWLSSVGRLTAIAAAKGEYHRLDKFKQMLEDCLSKIKYPEKNALGVAYLGLAQLALGQNDPNKIDIITEFLREGISLVIEFGSYARTDILSRLTIVEKYFHEINPEIVRSVGEKLQEYISKEEIENINYTTVTPKMYKWTNWREEVTHE